MCLLAPVLSERGKKGNTKNQHYSKSQHFFILHPPTILFSLHFPPRFPFFITKSWLSPSSSVRLITLLYRKQKFAGWQLKKASKASLLKPQDSQSFICRPWTKSENTLSPPSASTHTAKGLGKCWRYTAYSSLLSLKPKWEGATVIRTMCLLCLSLFNYSNYSIIACFNTKKGSPCSYFTVWFFKTHSFGCNLN